MNSHSLTSEKINVATANGEKVLNMAVTTWFVVAVAGQWMFAYYTLFFYGSSTLYGNIEKWNQVLPHGYVAGDMLGNVIVGIHVLLAGIILIGGPLQIIPQIRTYAPSFHRWSGRIYIFIAFVMSLSGLIMVWTRGTVGGMSQHISISINAVLIMACALLSIRYAMAREFKKHRIWALRLFLVVSGVWFFRVGLMFWLFINKGPVGFDMKTFQGPFLTFLAFSQYLLPLAILELYLRAKNSSNPIFRFATSALLFLATVIVGVGAFVATMGMWLPRL